MTIQGFLLLLVVGVLCGAIAERIVGYSPGGFLMSAVVGFLGAWLGSWLAGSFHFPKGYVVTIEGHGLDIVWTILGAVVLLLIVILVRRNAYNRTRFN